MSSASSDHCDSKDPLTSSPEPQINLKHDEVHMFSSGNEVPIDNTTTIFAVPALLKAEGVGVDVGLEKTQDAVNPIPLAVAIAVPAAVAEECQNGNDNDDDRDSDGGASTVTDGADSSRSRSRSNSNSPKPAFTNETNDANEATANVEHKTSSELATTVNINKRSIRRIKKVLKSTPSASRPSSTTGSGVGRKRKAKVVQSQQLPKSKKHNYKYVCSAKEDHGQPIFGCQFRPQRHESDPLILATVGSNRISVYECLPDGKLKMLMVFADPDSDEIYYCCAWTDDEVGHPLLAAAGAHGIIRIISMFQGGCTKHYLGHGHSINDLTVHPKDRTLLLSASKDHSLRMYNIRTDSLVAIFGGTDGHRDEVLAADIDITGSRIVSCGMDHSLKIWKLNKPEVEQAIVASHAYNSKTSKAPFQTFKQNFPDFSTRDIHRNYVDSTKWLGDFILSKSCENSIICWKPGKPGGSWDEIRISTTETSVFHRFEIRDCDIWFIRFTMDYWKRILALGNQCGKTYLYDLSVSPPCPRPAAILSHPKCTSAIRQTALSRDGMVLVCVCDDSTIWRWDLCQDSQGQEEKLDNVNVGAATETGTTVDSDKE